MLWNLFLQRESKLPTSDPIGIRPLDAEECQHVAGGMKMIQAVIKPFKLEMER